MDVTEVMRLLYPTEQEKSAATQVQSRFRGHAMRQRATRQKTAVIRIQANVRGKAARVKTKQWLATQKERGWCVRKKRTT